ncbi:MAG: sensor histidine kinase [Bacteroidota bacterium]
MAEYHKILKRQLAKYLPGQTLPPEMLPLLDAINQFYHYTDRDREMIERAMEISSEELSEANRKAQEELQLKLRAQEKAIEKESILKSINKNIFEAIFRRSLHGEIIFVNEAFVELFGYNSVAEVMATRAEQFYANPSDRNKLLERLLHEDTLKGVEILLKKKNGELFWGLTSAALGYDQNGNMFLDGAIVDISSIKEAEKNLLDTNEMLRKANEELDRFVYSASHDLRAPLMSLLGLIRVIELEKAEDISQYLEMMKKSIRRLDLFIKDIINHSKNSRLQPEVGLIDFPILLKDCYDQLQYLSIGSRIERITDFAIDSPFYNDIKRISVIFNNLLSNAINYQNPREPQPYIKTKIITSEDACTIEVTDNGTGISVEHQDKIFNMFYRANTEAKGSGLGLYIVKEIVDKLEGTIAVRSAPGNGTTFIVSLPNRKNLLKEDVRFK